MKIDLIIKNIGKLVTMENSFWILNNESEDYSALDKSIDVEYLIVGAGLTGLHTACLYSCSSR